MLPTYPAVLRAGRIEWTGDAPGGLPADRPVRVHVTLLDAPADPLPDGRQAAAILQQLADAGGLSAVPDPLAWERDQREDRPLPGREP